MLATPIVADLDGDGFPEVVFAVSYYFDRNKYASERVMDAMGVSIDTSMYVASGVVVYDTRTQRIRLSKRTPRFCVLLGVCLLLSLPAVRAQSST